MLYFPRFFPISQRFHMISFLAMRHKCCWRCKALHGVNCENSHGDQMCFIQTCFTWFVSTILQLQNSKFFNSLVLQTGADPRMVRIGTGPPFWQINHANSAYFRLFLGYFWVISATRAPPFWISAPLFTYPGSAPDKPLCKDKLRTSAFKLEMSRKRLAGSVFWPKIALSSLLILSYSSVASPVCQ